MRTTQMVQAAKAYEKHREANGHFENHAKAKEFLYAEYFPVVISNVNSAAEVVPLGSSLTMWSNPKV